MCCSSSLHILRAFLYPVSVAVFPAAHRRPAFDRLKRPAPGTPAASFGACPAKLFFLNFSLGSAYPAVRICLMPHTLIAAIPLPPRGQRSAAAIARFFVHVIPSLTFRLYPRYLFKHRRVKLRQRPYIGNGFFRHVRPCFLFVYFLRVLYRR